MASASQNRLSEFLPLLAFVAAWTLQLLYFLGYTSRLFFTPGFGILPLMVLAATAYAAGYFAPKMVPVLRPAVLAPRDPDVGEQRAAIILLRLTVVMATVLITVNILLPLVRGVSLSGARELALDAWENGGAGTRIIAVLANVTAAFSLMVIVDRISQRGRFPLLLTGMFVLVTIAIYSRAHLLLGLSIISTMWISRSKYRLSYIFLIFVLFAALFSILSVIASVGSADRNAGIEDVFKSLEVYTFGGVAGFDFYHATGIPAYRSLLTIPRFIYSVLPGLGEPPPSYFPFIDTIPPINVFSALYPPYHDFGALGLSAFFFLYGAISSVAAYAFQARRNRYLCVIAGFLLYAALMSPFDDQYIRGLTIFILIMAGALVYGAIFRVLCGASAT